MARKKSQEEEWQKIRAEKRRVIENAEQKYQELITKRDEFNTEARRVRDERDAFRQKKDEIFSGIEDIKRQKNEIGKILAEHKTKRDEYQKKAKELINIKKQKRGKIYASLSDEVLELQAELQYLELTQQTKVMSLHDENEIVERIRKTHEKVVKYQKELEVQDKLSGEVHELDSEITKLFENADKEHAEVIKLAGQMKELTQKIINTVNETAHIINEANKKHQEYLELREKADECHRKAKEMRDKIITTRRELREFTMESKKLIEEHNIKVRDKFDDKKKLDEKAEENLLELLKKGKISLR